MKNLLIGLFVLGLTNLMHSQSFEASNEATNEIQLEAVTLSPLNISYLTAVKDEHTPARAVILENKVARYDITEHPIYSKKFEAYEVVFEETNGRKGRIIATYDMDGKVLTSFERFRDVSLPPAVRNAVKKAYPDWVIQNDMYLVSYFTGDKVDKLYKIQIKNKNQKKNLRIDTNGQFI